jgi:hypothetical protein
LPDAEAGQAFKAMRGSSLAARQRKLAPALLPLLRALILFHVDED